MRGGVVLSLPRKRGTRLLRPPSPRSATEDCLLLLFVTIGLLLQQAGDGIKTSEHRPRRTVCRYILCICWHTVTVLLRIPSYIALHHNKVTAFLNTPVALTSLRIKEGSTPTRAPLLYEHHW